MIGTAPDESKKVGKKQPVKESGKEAVEREEIETLEHEDELQSLTGKSQRHRFG